MVRASRLSEGWVEWGYWSGGNGGIGELAGADLMTGIND